MRLLVYGSQTFALTAAELAFHCGHEVLGFVDDYSKSANVIGSFDHISRTYAAESYGFILAVGYNDLRARWVAWERVRCAGYCLPSLVHPRAYVADTAQVGDGCMIMANATVDVRATLGDGVVVWPGACINHDSRIDKNSFVSPNAVVCGHARVGAHCFIGAGAAIADSRVVPDSSFIKMLSAYTSNKL